MLYAFLVRPQEILRAVLAVNDPSGRVFVFLAAERGGIFIFEADAAGALTQLGEFAIDGPARGLNHETYSGDRQILFVAAGENGLRILDVSVPTRPDEIAFLTAPGEAQGGALVSQDDRVYYLSAAGRAGLHVVDVTDPALPVLVSTFDSRGSVTDVVISADKKTAYLADQRAGLVALDIQKLVNLSANKRPEEIGTLRIPGQAREMLLNGEQLFIASGSAGLVIVDVADPSAPKLSAGYDNLPNANSLDIWRGYVYVADTQKGVRALNIFDREQIFDVTKERYGNNPQALDILDGRIFVGDGILGLRVYDADVTLDTARMARSAPALQAHGVTQAGSGLLYIASPDRGL
ncbi:MAG TPA: hypothetical protein VLS48_02405, partial [Anaerolineales bacterium]|nr:hypothetical protein [Anaerolineales bacterium]